MSWQAQAWHDIRKTGGVESRSNVYTEVGMHALLSAAGRSFLRAFAAALVTFAPGILSAPSLDSALLVGVSALLASIAAGIRTLQAYIPALTFTKYVGADFGRYLDTFVQVFVGALVVTLPGLLHYPDQGNWQAFWTSIVAAVLAALSRAIQALGTPGETITSASAPGAGGLKTPANA